MTKTILMAFLLATIIFGSMTPYVFADEDDDDKKTKFKKHKVYTGDGPPPPGLGQVGDLYIDSSNTDNLVIYKKTAKKTWTNLGSFQGEQGPQGEKGTQARPAGILTTMELEICQRRTQTVMVP
jgi:hypothetical protein